MKTYQSHKIVRAAKITHPPVRSDDETRIVKCDDGDDRYCPEAMFARFVPAPGDYLVEYGMKPGETEPYRSFSPCQAFEDGYTEVGSEQASDEGERPAFEVRDVWSGHVFSVFADGRIEGFPPTATLIVNRIPRVKQLPSDDDMIAGSVGGDVQVHASEFDMRAFALARAIEHGGNLTPANIIVAVAEQFYAYLAGAEAPAATGEPS